jgi:Ca2+-binding RTX toxin-like protein
MQRPLGKELTMSLITGTPGPGTPFDDVIFGTAGPDVIYALGGNDKVFARAGHDTVYGGTGHDTLYGEAGFDYLSGGSGNDLLVGGADSDRLSGGTGADTFRMNTAAEANGDRIYDFTKGTFFTAGDKIDLHNIDAVENKWWSPGTWGNQAFSFIHTNNFTGAGQVRYFNAGGNTYVQGSTDSDSAAEFTIALTGTMSLRSSDFWL